jgi:methylamine---corrinoid protein Co-methyltransferase
VARQGMSREQANALALELLAQYETQAADAPIGSEYQECYDVAKAVPTQAHYDMYCNVKDELAQMGIDFPY